MGARTNIEWADATLNFWTGCTKVSEGCKFCYMYRDKERYGQRGDVILANSDDTILKVFKALKVPSRIFVNSWSDFFIEHPVAEKMRGAAYEIFKLYPEHRFMILTKRPENMEKMLPDDWGTGYPNVWLGVSIENNDVKDERMYHLRSTAAISKFISAEPLLEPLTGMDRYLGSVDWLIIGGESGNDKGSYRYRPMEYGWAYDLVVEANDFENVAIFFKQTGTHLSKELGLKDRHGRDINELPFPFRIRNFPTPKYRSHHAF